jgi:integrase
LDVSVPSRRQGWQDSGFLSAHTCRHTFALTFLRRNPGKLIELSTLLGHESLDTTAVYLCPSAEELARAVEEGDDE